MKRNRFSKTFKIPDYYISVTYRDLNERKKRWAKERLEGRKRPGIKKWEIPSKKDPYIGLVVKVNTAGEIESKIPSDFLHGIMIINSQLLSASHHEITAHSLDLTKSTLFSSHHQFNALHSLRKTKNGLLVASCGSDSIFELSPDGKKVIWSWWATDNGYSNDFFGEKRVLDKNIDHRHIEYGTWLGTAHVNAAEELNDNNILATVFMTGELIKINKKTGKHIVIKSNLRRPHAIRVYKNNKISFADTQNGKALFGSLIDNEFCLENSVLLQSNWLQDCLFKDGYWVLVDGENSRVYFVDTYNNILAFDQFDTDWYLYETAFNK